MKYPELNTSSIIGGQEYPAEKRISRDVLEFDALIVNITKVPVHHLRLLRRYSAASVIETVGMPLISTDHDIEAFEQHLTDLVLVSKFSPLSLDQNSYSLKNYDFGSRYFDENSLEIREWCLLNLMIVVWDAERAYGERAGLCVLHEDIWNQWDPQFKHIRLA